MCLRHEAVTEIFEQAQVLCLLPNLQDTRVAKGCGTSRAMEKCPSVELFSMGRLIGLC